MTFGRGRIRKGKPDPLKPGTPAWDKRQHVYKHNAALGHIAAIDSQLKCLTSTRSLSPLAQTICAQIWGELYRMREDVAHWRIELDGTAKFLPKPTLTEEEEED